MKRIGETHWTGGAYLRGARRQKYILVNLGGNQIAFGRQADLVEPVFLKDIYRRKILKLYRMEEILTGRTELGRQLLRDQNWTAVKVDRDEIKESFWGRKNPLAPLPYSQVSRIQDDLGGLIKGQLSNQALTDLDRRLKPADITGVSLIPKSFILELNQVFQDAAYQNVDISARVRPPEAVAELLADMGVEISFSRRLLVEQWHGDEMYQLLANLRQVMWQAQRTVDRIKKGISFKLPKMTITSSFDSDTLQVDRLFFRSPAEQPLTIFSICQTADQFLGDLDEIPELSGR